MDVIPGQLALFAPDIRPLNPGQRIAGPATTVFAFPHDGLLGHKAVQLIRPGQVLVISNGGARPQLMFAELIALAARAAGAAGGGRRGRGPRRRGPAPRWTSPSGAAGSYPGNHDGEGRAGRRSTSPSSAAACAWTPATSSWPTTTASSALRPRPGSRPPCARRPRPAPSARCRIRAAIAGWPAPVRPPQPCRPTLGARRGGGGRRRLERLTPQNRSWAASMG